MGEKNQSQDKITTLVIGQSGQVDPKLPHSRFESCPATGVTSDPKSTGNSNVFLSMLYAQSGIHPVWTPKLVCQKESSPFPTSTSSQSNPQSHGSERHDWSDDTTHASDQNLNDQSNMDCETHDSPAAGPSAASSFYHDSDGNATSAKVAKDNHKSFVDSDHRRYDGFIGTDSHRTSQREAALIKFRLKRKDRCYEKKVLQMRYYCF